MGFQLGTLSISELEQTSRGKQLLPQLLKDYLSGNPSLVDYYEHKPDIRSFSSAINNRSKKTIDRAGLTKVLLKQYADLDDAPSNISLLTESNTFTVTTGHQLCLFTGPLYLCYKILTVVNLAEELKQEYPDNNFVPIFWMASEDHDFEEVNHFHLFGNKVAWEAEAGNAVGRLKVDRIRDVIIALKEQFQSDNSAIEVLSTFERAYLDQDNLANATRALLHGLFGHYGLVVIDADDKILKKSFTKVMKAEVEGQLSMHAMASTYEALSKSYKLPVKSRDINLFYLHGEKRSRLEVGDGGKVSIVGTDILIDQEKCSEMVESSPQDFSPNVVLRPLYQEVLLPNLAYIGGPSEIAYWLELKGVFDEHRVSFPLLLPRNSLLILGRSEKKRMRQFAMDSADLFADPDELVKSIVSKLSREDLSLNTERDELSTIYSKLAIKARLIDASLEQAIKSEEARTLGQLDKLEKKLSKAAKSNNQAVVNQVEKLLKSVFPMGVFQERYESLFSQLVRFDFDVIDEMKGFIDPFDNSLKILSEAANS
jgi:bacillithiol biosynthesis cysteine-adding enzyme BshC